MCNNQTCLIYGLLIILLFFGSYIIFLLKLRKRFYYKNTQLSSDQVWHKLASRAQELGFSKPNLIFGINQDKSHAVAQLTLKDSHNSVLGHIEYPLGKREFLVTMGEGYRICLPLTWRKTARLIDSNGLEIARFERLPFSYTAHKFVIPELGELISKRPNFNFYFPFEYTLNHEVVGLTQAISTTRAIGRVGVFSDKIPVIIRVFILAIN